MKTECFSQEEIKKVQFSNLAATLERVLSRSEYYRSAYRRSGFSLSQLKSTDDLGRLPFTSRKELAAHFREMICEPRSRWIDICPTSGTTGKSIYFPMTSDDLVFLSDLCARGARGLGIDENDTIQVMLTSDNLLQPSRVMTYMFNFHLGSLTLRAGPVGNARQIQLMRELQPTIIFGIPTYLLSLGRSFTEYGFDPKKDLNLKLLISTGATIYHGRWEPTSLNREIVELWGAPCYSILGSTELNTGLWECPARCGHHIHHDYYIAEIIDPVTERILEPGKQGELVLTLTGRQAMPLIRYRTGDITSVEVEPCSCGRKSPRIMAIAGRLDQRIKIKGAGVFPLQIEEAILSVKRLSAYLVEVITDEKGQAQIIITIDNNESRISADIKRAVKNKLNISPMVKTDARKNIEAIWYSEKRVKPRKFWDRRKT